MVPLTWATARALRLQETWLHIFLIWLLVYFSPSVKLHHYSCRFPSPSFFTGFVEKNVLDVFRNVFKKLTQASAVLISRNVRVCQWIITAIWKRESIFQSVTYLCITSVEGEAALKSIWSALVDFFFFFNCLTDETDYICVTLILVCFVI